VFVVVMRLGITLDIGEVNGCREIGLVLEGPSSGSTWTRCPWELSEVNDFGLKMIHWYHKVRRGAGTV
jgi:hypothetical protein